MFFCLSVNDASMHTHTHRYMFHLKLSCLIHTASSQTAWKVIRTSLLEISTTYTTHCLCGVHTILCHQHHPAHHLVRLLPLQRRFRSICTRTTTMSHSHFPQAVGLLNDLSAPAPTHHTPSYNNCKEVGFALLQYTTFTCLSQPTLSLPPPSMATDLLLLLHSFFYMGSGVAHFF